jgi:hypothetical protein
VERRSFVLREKRSADKGGYSSPEVGGGTNKSSPLKKNCRVVKCHTGLRTSQVLSEDPKAENCFRKVTVGGAALSFWVV